MGKFLLTVLLSLNLMGAGGGPSIPPASSTQSSETSTNQKIDELQAMVDAKKYRAAIRKGLTLGKQTKSARAYNLVGYSFRQLKKYKKAIKAYKIALKIDPNLTIAKEYLGVAFLHQNNIKGAKKIYRILKREDPSLAKMLYFEAEKLGISL